VLFRSPPVWVFSTPALKENLQESSDRLNEQFFSFATLFAAWGLLNLRFQNRTVQERRLRLCKMVCDAEAVTILPANNG